MKNIKQIIGVVFTAITFVVSCSKENNINVVKVIQLKFKNNINEKSEKNSKNSGFSTYDVTLNSSGQLSVNDDELTISEAINKDTGTKSYVITKKESSSVTLKSLQLKSSTNPQIGGGGFVRGYWYDGNDCFIYGTIYTGDDGTLLFVPADAATQSLMNNCGWSNVA